VIVSAARQPYVRREYVMRRQAAVKLLMLGALVAGTIALVLPATASADALVETQAPCVAFLVGGNVYAGSGTSLVTATGLAVLTCHLRLVSGTLVAEATRTTTAGGCDVIETPSGLAIMTCFHQL
jgi:hypothetical protein